MLKLSTKEMLEEARNELNTLVLNSDNLTNEDVVKLSQKLDEYIVEYSRQQLAM
jgi:plasmid maintenance system antidote protein VapI